MFLGSQNRLFGLITRQKPDHGSVLVAVVGVMAAALLISVVIAAVLSSAFTFSSSTRAGIQAQAAAEGGIAAALAGVNTNGNCEANSGVYQSSVPPIYRATVWRSNDGVTWSIGCPISSTTKIRIIASGSAQSPGVLNASANNQIFVEAIYGYGAASAGGNTPGLAMYSYSIGQLDTYQLLSPGGQGSDVGIRTGNFACTGPTIIDGTVKVQQGGANLTNTCVINYSLFTSGSVQLSTYSRVLGNVTSSGGGVTLSNSTTLIAGDIFANGAVSTNGGVGGSIEAVAGVAVVQGATVSGSIRAGSNVSISAPVGGNVTTPGNLTMVSTARVGGNILVGGTLSFGHLNGAAAAAALKSQGLVTGTISYGQAGLQAPVAKPAPIVPDWIDVSYSFADWQASGFSTELGWPSALGCRLGDSSSTSPSGVLYPFYQQLKSLSQPTVIDARGCASVDGNVSLPLRTDLAFIANAFSFDTLNVTAADSGIHHIWFIIPDAQPSVAGPQCTKKGGTFAINSTSTIGTGVEAFAYASCSIAINNGTVWQGQLYSGDMSGGGGLRELHYIPMGIPGSSIGGGVIPPSMFQTGALISMRNRTDSGQ